MGRKDAARRGSRSATYELHAFTASTPYQLLKEEGLVRTAGIMWRVLRDAELNMRLAAMSNLFSRCPEYFGYGIFTACKPRSTGRGIPRAGGDGAESATA